MQDGTPCKNAVNINACPFCDYHVQGEYNKIRTKRGECKDSRLHRAFHHANGARLGQPLLLHQSSALRHFTRTFVVLHCTALQRGNSNGMQKPAESVTHNS